MFYMVYCCLLEFGRINKFHLLMLRAVACCLHAIKLLASCTVVDCLFFVPIVCHECCKEFSFAYVFVRSSFAHLCLIMLK